MLTDGHPSGSVTRLRELVEQRLNALRLQFEQSRDMLYERALTERHSELHVSAQRSKDWADVWGLAARCVENASAELATLAAALAPAVVPSVDQCLCSELSGTEACPIHQDAPPVVATVAAPVPEHCLCQIDMHNFNCPVHNDSGPARRGPNGDE